MSAVFKRPHHLTDKKMLLCNENMGQRSKQTTTEKILWAIFDLMESTDTTLPSKNDFYVAFHTSFEYAQILKRLRWRWSRHQFAKFISDLKRRGYIKTKIERDKRAVMLTPKGFEKSLKINFERKDRKKRRDNKWQMIIWDIPETYKKTRNRFRAALKLLNYQQLQQSVWICPYDVSRETEKMIRLYGIEDYVRMFLISEIET